MCCDKNNEKLNEWVQKKMMKCSLKDWFLQLVLNVNSTMKYSNAEIEDKMTKIK